jgi:hypothetical protein
VYALCSSTSSLSTLYFFIKFILYVFIWYYLSNQKSVNINLLTRLTVHCMLETLFVLMKPDNIFRTCSCRAYGCIVAAIVYIFYQLISQGIKLFALG